MDIPLTCGGVCRVEPVAPHTFRVRLRPDDTFTEPALVRYGVLRREWPPVEYTVEETDEVIRLGTAEATLTVARVDGRMTLQRRDGEALTANTSAPWSGPEEGFGAELTLVDGERLYGLGDVTRDRIQMRGHRAQMWVKNVSAYVPVPFVMSSRGWAVFVNTTWRHVFDLGQRQPDRMRFGGRRGELDYYLFVGDDLPALLDRYTDLAGKPTLLPLWAYGLTFVCNQQADAREMLDDCLNFRREGIPCDGIGLEPGWMETRYDYSVEKRWHPERFYLPAWSREGPHTFLSAAARLGFKVSLWLCADYDLSHEEERQAAGHSEAAAGPETGTPHPDDFEQDTHIGHHPVLMDRITRLDEPWFAHLRPFVDQGVAAFKMDGARQVNEHPDRRWGNGMDDEQMHNLYPTLLNKQMHQGFAEHAERRPMIYSSGGYAGIGQYAATWSGDTGGGPKPLISMLNHGLSGHANTSCDMDVFTPAGIHFGFLQPWSQVCSWAYWRHPWLLGDALLPIFKKYARLRYRLLPYLYSLAHVAARTGMPVLRAMPLAFPDDPRSDDLLHQYLLGDSLLAAAFTDTVYLPSGRWIDYWTGEMHKGCQEIVYTPPPGCGGPLFVRAGAILPNGPEMDYTGQKSWEELTLHLYPHGESAFTLYEDDGVSFGYRDGAVATTQITCRAENAAVHLTLGARNGQYDGIPETRRYALRLYKDAAPESVTVDAETVTEWHYDAGAQAVLLTVPEVPSRPCEVVFRFG